jgi:DNA (cytosine-5)-methyltransferase 1
MHQFIDLFCGIGGFRVALEKQGMNCVFSCDIDEQARKAYYENFKETPAGDITEISEKEIPKHDILCAGFPCQSFSISGKQGAMKDNRGQLFYEIVRIARYHQPYVMLLENVKNILSVDDGKVIKTIKTKLDEIGYYINLSILNASHFGVPQARERVYFVCLRKDIISNSDFILKYKQPKPNNKQIFLENILEKKVDESLYIDREDIVINKENVEHQLKPIRIGIVNKGGQGERIYSPFGHAITQSAYGGGVGARTGLYLIDDRVRRLSITESKRVMGFPITHFVSDGIQGYQQLGNAVIPDMISYVYNSIKAVA